MSPLTAYHSLLLSNLSTVQTIESGLSNITWFLPGRFEDAELASEGLYALLGLVSNYHDQILHSHIPRELSLPPHPFIDHTVGRISPLLPAESEHTRYTRYWTKRSTTYKRAGKALSTIGYLELVVEMIAKKKGGDRFRWRVVLFIELIKTFLRLTILKITKRPVLSSPTPQREIDPSSLPSEILSSSSSSDEDQSTSKIKAAPLTQLLTPYAPLKDHLYPMIDNLPESHKTHPLNLIKELKGKEYISEIIWSSVGLMHVLLLMRSSRQSNASAYKPLSLPTLSRSYIPYLSTLRLLLLARVLRPSHKTSNLGMTHNSSQDRKLLARAFLTGPMWLGFTRPKVLGLTRLVEKIPIVGLVGDLVEGYLPLVDDYFYCELLFQS
ncbi:peroxin-16 [Kwoniella mangroviensis CBS 10435]|uniref:Peroxisomal membrane protein PEX16 n=1 Tax=Kwoniella mangroviensis CBS 10435 TaxID=1331196 RepID=A0A1B9IPR6_9TREE|nr:peroxin-16 [Kwoniella mangroviensis CBS 10435]